MRTNTGWTIGTKLWVLSGSLLVNLLVLGFIGYWNGHKLTAQVHDIVESQMPAIQNMILTDMMHDGIRANVLHSLVIAESAAETERQQVRAEASEYATNIATHLETLRRLPMAPETKASVDAATKEVVAYSQAAKDLVDTALKGEKAAAMSMLPAFQERFSALEGVLGELGDRVLADAARSSKEARLMADRSDRFSWMAIGVGCVVGIVSSMLIIGSLQRSLGEVMRQLDIEARSVTGVAEDLSASSKSLADTSMKQMDALGRTAAAVSEIKSMLRRTEGHTADLEQSSRQSQDAATQGRQGLEGMIGSIAAISEGNSKIMEKVMEGNQRITEVVRVVAEIGEKTKVINDIVFQTKLLSFNASVEAARAGEHGKGFSIVAAEVGNLAQMSGSAAKEISDLLEVSIQQVEGIVRENKDGVEALMSDGQGRLEAGRAVALQCESALRNIIDQSVKVSNKIIEISAVIREQNTGISSVSDALDQLDAATRRNTETSKATSANAAQMLGQAEALNGIVTKLVDMTNHSKAAIKAASA